MLDELLLSGLTTELEVARGIMLRSIVGYVEGETKNTGYVRCGYSVMVMRDQLNC